MNTIYIDESKGTAYMIEKGGVDVLFAPLRTNGTFNFEEGGIVEEWSEDGDEEAANEEVRVRTMLGAPETIELNTLMIGGSPIGSIIERGGRKYEVTDNSSAIVTTAKLLD